MSSVSFGSGGGDANNNNAASSGASEHDSTADGGRRVQPQRLELTLSPEDGSLATAPLSSVIVAATDALYADLYDMTNGEIEVTTTAAQTTSAAAGGGGGMDGGSEHPTSASAADTDAGGAATAAALTASAAPPPAAPSGNYAAHMAALTASAKKEKMASLSFAQRRHELASRIARHSRAVSHVAGLVGGYGYDHQPRGAQQQQRRGQHQQHHGGGTGGKMPAPGELASIVDLSSRTFRHVRQSWVQADEAQDALYFHHDQLWKARRHVHDVRGALAVVCGGDDSGDDDGRAGKEAGDEGKAANADDVDDGDESKTTTDGAAAASSALAGFAGRWVDFPTDAALLVDRYETSNEKSLSKTEVLERLRGAVRRKLVLGEVGSVVVAAAAAADSAGNANANKVERFKLPWRIALEGGGGAVRLTYGEPRSFSVHDNGGVDSNSAGSGSSANNTGGADVYPIEARLTVLSESDESEDPPSETTRKPAEWTLLSVRTSVSAKTGESNHQLDLTRRQMFDLHRLCVRAMTVEEAQARKANELLAAAAAAADDGDDAKAEDVEEKNGGGGGTKKEEADRGSVPMEIDSSSAAAASSTPKDAKSSSGNRAPSFPAALRRRDGTVVARPLSCLFDVAHTFAASLQLEVLSSQAVALQRGAWGGIAVSPVHFFDRGVDGSKTKKAEGRAKIVGVGAGHDEDGGEEAAAAAAPLAVMAMHFWAVDDRYGHPALGDLTPATAASPPMAKSQSQPIKGEPAAAPKAADSAAADLASVTSSVRSKRTSASVRTTTERHLPPSDDRGNGRLTLSLRAVPGMGVVASISGGDGVAAALAEGGGGDGGAGDGVRGGGDANTGTDDEEERQRAAARRRHVRRNVTKLLTATSDPFNLSASDALLAATVLCAERRSEAVASALLRGGARKGTSETSAAASPSSSSPLLPAWLDLEVECGTISVAARISYLGGGGGGDGKQEEDNGFVELFRLACDSRTGRFVPTFPRAASLLRSLACNDPRASELQTLRNAVVSSRGRNVPSSQKRRNVGSDLTGRAVRDAFEGLARSVDVLGRRVGVGGSWVDADRTSPSLRDRSVDLACGDVRSSLLACSGAAAVYGVSALALGACSGVDAAADVAGGPIVARADSTDKPTSNGAADVEGGESSSPPLLPIPPLGIVTSQHMIEKKETGGDGEVKSVTLLEREVFAVSASVADDALTVRCFDVTTHIESPSLPPTRISCVPAPLAAKKEDATPYDASADEESHPKKRSRIEKSSSVGPSTSGRHRQMLHEVELLAARFGNTLY